MAAPRPTLGNWQGGSLNDPILITAFYLISAEGYQEPRNEFGCQSPVERISGIRSWRSIPLCQSLQWSCTCFTRQVSRFILPRHLLFLNLFYCHSKNKNVFRSHFFSHFHVCTIQRPNGQTTIQLSIIFRCKKQPIYRL